MKLSYGQLNMIIYDIVYGEAAEKAIEDVESLLGYLDEHENQSVLVLNDDQ